MINEIKETLEEVRTAIAMSEEDDVIRVLHRVEEKLEKWIYTYEDDGK